MQLKVWILDHDWGDDRAFGIFHSKESAETAIQSYVQDQWNDGNMDDEEYPENPSAAVDLYFEYHENNEWYSIRSQIVDFPHLPDLPDEEVVLNEDECSAVLCALALSNIKEVATYLNLQEDEATKAMDSAYAKLKD